MPTGEAWAFSVGFSIFSKKNLKVTRNISLEKMTMNFGLFGVRKKASGVNLCPQHLTGDFLRIFWSDFLFFSEKKILAHLRGTLNFPWTRQGELGFRTSFLERSDGFSRNSKLLRIISPKRPTLTMEDTLNYIKDILSRGMS